MKTIDFSKYSSIRIGPLAQVKIINKIEKENENFTVIGGANNLLVSNNPPKLAKLSKEFDYIKEKDGFLYIGGATPSGKVVSYCKKHDIKGFELLQKLPGLLGGIIKMNAGLKKHEIFNNLTTIKTVNGYIKKEDISFGYRHTDIKSIVYEGVFEKRKGFDEKLFEYFETLRKNQPNLPSAGSCFKNPPNNYAGKLLQECGLKGYRVGDMGFSEIHANFLVNYGNGAFKDAMSLINIAKKRVLDMFGIKLELEIVVL